MNDDLNINSFDELKAALDSALRNGAVLPESADYLMERFDVLCVDIDNVFLSISVNDIKDIGCVSHGRETCLDELAETYGEDDACHNGGALVDAGTHAR